MLFVQRSRVACTALLMLVGLGTAHAQRPDSTVLRVPIPDTASPRARPVRPTRPEDIPPVSPRRAFLYSLMLPGLGQAALDRRYTGAGFFLVEAAALAMVHRSAEDVRLAKAFKGDSVPLSYQTDPATGLVVRNAAGDPVVAAWKQSQSTTDLIKARNLHYDWIAVIIFNHLVAGADAFVAANLWDFSAHVKMRASPLVRGGAAVSFTISHR
jgi:hypothetical protein